MFFSWGLLSILQAVGLVEELGSCEGFMFFLLFGLQLGVLACLGLSTQKPLRGASPFGAAGSVYTSDFGELRVSSLNV